MSAIDHELSQTTDQVLLFEGVSQRRIRVVNPPPFLEKFLQFARVFLREKKPKPPPPKIFPSIQKKIKNPP